MDIILKQSGNRVGLYIDKQLATVFEDATFESVKEWISKNLANTKIYISG